MSDPRQVPRRVLVIDDNRAIHDDFRKTLAPSDDGAEARRPRGRPLRRRTRRLARGDALRRGLRRPGARRRGDGARGHRGGEALLRGLRRHAHAAGVGRGHHHQAPLGAGPRAAVRDLHGVLRPLVGGHPPRARGERPLPAAAQALRRGGGVPAGLRALGEVAPRAARAPQARAAAEHGRRADAGPRRERGALRPRVEQRERRALGLEPLHRRGLLRPALEHATRTRRRRAHRGDPRALGGAGSPRRPPALPRRDAAPRGRRRRPRRGGVSRAPRRRAAPVDALPGRAPAARATAGRCAPPARRPTSPTARSPRRSSASRPSTTPSRGCPTARRSPGCWRARWRGAGPAPTSASP